MSKGTSEGVGAHELYAPCGFGDMHASRQMQPKRIRKSRFDLFSPVVCDQNTSLISQAALIEVFITVQHA